MDGALVAATAEGDVRFTAPEAYQMLDGSRRSVSAAYDVHGNTYGFRLGPHDPTAPVVIDPLLQSTYLGGNSYDSTSGIAIDPASGDIFVAGATVSTDFPGTTGGAQPANGGGGEDAFVARFDATLPR
jgi:hypothetical protein